MQAKIESIGYKNETRISGTGAKTQTEKRREQVAAFFIRPFHFSGKNGKCSILYNN